MPRIHPYSFGRATTSGTYTRVAVPAAAFSRANPAVRVAEHDDGLVGVSEAIGVALCVCMSGRTTRANADAGGLRSRAGCRTGGEHVLAGWDAGQSVCRARRGGEASSESGKASFAPEHETGGVGVAGGQGGVTTPGRLWRPSCRRGAFALGVCASAARKAPAWPAARQKTGCKHRPHELDFAKSKQT